MAPLQSGAWSLKLNGKFEWTPILRLHRDLHVTRAALTHAPRQTLTDGDSGGVCYQIVPNAHDQSDFNPYCGSQLCTLGYNHTWYPREQVVNKVFLAGEWVRFQLMMRKSTTGAIRLDGHFQQSSAQLQQRAVEKRERLRRPRDVYRKYMARDDDFCVGVAAAASRRWDGRRELFC